MLHSIAEVQSMIAAGKGLFLAGSAEALAQLPTGNWIGGSSYYFMSPEGGVDSGERIFVTDVPATATGIRICGYDEHSLPSLYADAPANGFTFLLIPGEAPFRNVFASDASKYDGFLIKPVVGWVAGVKIEDIGKRSSCVVDGRTGRATSQHALAMHVGLPSTQTAELSIVNIFKQGDGDIITFAESGHSASGCFINGQPASFAQYIAARNLDTSLPLTADYCGNIINVAFKLVDLDADIVHFYNFAVAGVEYRLAQPVPDYSEAFAQAIPPGPVPAFSCNCIHNYLYGKLAGRLSGNATGPITFGEIAYMLLNQTLVQLTIHSRL
jgi:hypothetical protein